MSRLVVVSNRVADPSQAGAGKSGGEGKSVDQE